MISGCGHEADVWLKQVALGSGSEVQLTAFADMMMACLLVVIRCADVVCDL
jgi:hypothetical protein